jgi:hypothetical protein
LPPSNKIPFPNCNTNFSSTKKDIKKSIDKRKGKGDRRKITPRKRKE